MPIFIVLIVVGVVVLFLGAIIGALKGLVFIAIIAIAVGLLGWRIRVYTHQNPPIKRHDR